MRLLIVVRSLLALGLSLGLVLGSGMGGSWAGVAIATDAYEQGVDAQGVYEQVARPDPDGIGKRYQGREIAQVMGHQGAGWLERTSRRWEEQPAKAIAALALQPTDVVADIGVGTGYFSFRMAPQVAKVYAVDIQPEMLEIVEALKQRDRVENVETVLGTETSPNLPASAVDLVLLVDAYHEFAYPVEMMKGIVEALKPGGRVVLLEYRAENPLVLIKRLHKMTEAQVRQELELMGLEFVENRSVLPQQHFLVFRKTA